MAHWVGELRRLVKQVWFDGRRLHREHRSRLRFAIGLGLLIVITMIFVLGLLPPLAIGGAIPLAALVVLRLSVSAIHKRTRDSGELTTLATFGDDTLPISLAGQLETHLIVLSALVHRASSELLLATQSLMPGIEIVTRNSVLNRMRELQVWDDACPDARVLLMKPDGAWTREEAYSTLFYFEFVRCLHWVLGLSSSLEPLSSNPRPAYQLATELLFGKQSPTHWPSVSVISGQAMVAVGYFYRARYELSVRSLADLRIEAETRDIATSYLLRAYREGYADVYDSDFPVGARTMHEISDEELWGMERISRLRALILAGVAEAATVSTEDWDLWRWLSEAEGAHLIPEPVEETT